jgi:Domain of unknown function (DUF4391)
LENLNQILQLPEKCLVYKKITKVFFKRNFDLSLSERKLVDAPNVILQIDWVASLKPEQVNIPSHKDEQTIVEEVQVICVRIGDDDFHIMNAKVIDLIQKYIPYHIVLCVFNNCLTVFNTSSKKINQNDSNKRTIEKSVSTEIIEYNNASRIQSSFLESIAYVNLNKHDLKSLFDSYTASIITLQTAKLIGEFAYRPIERSKKDIESLELISKMEDEILQLNSQAKKETQLNTQVKINAEVQYRRREIEQIKQKLKV